MKNVFTLSLFLMVFASCNNQGSYKKAEDAQDAAREFIRASLDGNYDKAKFYLYADSSTTNKYLMERWEKNYASLPAEEKQKYRDADIIVLNLHPENDSVSTFTYFNSYKKDTTTIKVLRINGEWLVDLKELAK